MPDGTMSTKRVAYRPDIDGLRAIAVIAVIINHISSQSLPSGFLGVDVFFVISGFVITGSLLGQSQPSFFKYYIHFFSRRVKRLLPALTVCVGATSLLTLTLDPYPEDSIRTGIASLFGLANLVLFNLELDYFSASSKYNAFTHMWSLGVEEQFYVIFPFIVWFSCITSSAKSHNRGSLVLVLSVLSVISMLAFLWLYDRNQPAAYFLTPMRMWELGIGALAFVGLQKSPLFLLRWNGGVISNVTLLALLSCFLVPISFSGWATLLSVVLTGILLMTSQNALSEKVLSLPPTVYVGKISYSLYLWHWPLITLLPYLDNPLLKTTWFTVVAMFLVAIASYHLLEKPLRHTRWSNSPGLDIVVGIGASVVFCVAILLTQDSLNSSVIEGDVNPYPPAFLPLKNSGLPYNPNCVVDGRKRLLTPDKFQLCTVAAKPGSEMPTIWAMGDSHAGHLQGLLYEVHDTIGAGIHLIETPGAPFPSSSLNLFSPRKKIFAEIMDHLKAGDILLLSRLYLKRQEKPELKPDLQAWGKRVSELADQLSELNVSIVIMGPPPMFQFEDIRNCDPANRDSCVLERPQFFQHIQPIHKMLNDLTERHENVFWFDTFDSLCPTKNTHCQSSEGGVFLYRDRDHLNSYGSKRLATPFVRLLRNSGALLH